MTGALTDRYCEWLRSDSTANLTLGSEVRHPECHSPNIRRKLATNWIRSRLSFLSLRVLGGEGTDSFGGYSHRECFGKFHCDDLFLCRGSIALSHGRQALRRSLGWASVCFKWEWRRSLCVFLVFLLTENSSGKAERSVYHRTLCVSARGPSIITAFLLYWNNKTLRPTSFPHGWASVSFTPFPLNLYLRQGLVIHRPAALAMAPFYLRELPTASALNFKLMKQYRFANGWSRPCCCWEFAAVTLHSSQSKRKMFPVLENQAAQRKDALLFIETPWSPHSLTHRALIDTQLLSLSHPGEIIIFTLSDSYCAWCAKTGRPTTAVRCRIGISFD